MDASSVSLLMSCAAVSSTTGTTSRERWLLVEHDPRLRESIRAQLGLDRYVCDIVVDGEAALRSAKVQVFDLIVMDLGTPLVAGRQICRTLRRETLNRRVPIVMIASRNAEADALTEIEHGADDF